MARMARRNIISAWLWLLGPLLSFPAAAAGGDVKASASTPGLADLGGVGLMDTPTARMLPDGTLAFGAGLSGPGYRTATLTLQPLPWLEASLRETLKREGVGWSLPAEGGIGLKAGLSAESRWWPALAVGIRDLAGGRFSGEYLVAAKRWHAFDVTFGLGWGRLGEAGGLTNPLNVFGGRYHRPRDPLTQPAGPASWFTGGSVAPFGGVAWRTPLEGLTVKAEFSPDRRQLDRLERPGLSPGGPVTVGAAWRPLDWLELDAGFEHGRDLMLRASLLLDATTAALPRLKPSGLPHPTPSAVVEGRRAIAWLEPDREVGDAYPPGQVVGRALVEMAERAPPNLEEVTVVTGARGLDGVAVSALASEVRRAGRGRSSAPEIRQSGRLEPGAAVSALAPLPEGWRPETAPPWRGRVIVRHQESPFESLEPAAHRFGFDVESELEVTPGLIYSHTVRTTLFHNLESLDASIVRSLVRGRRAVRSDLLRYVGAAPVNSLERVALTWLAQPDPDWTTRLSAGWFEEIYGGLSGEVLYRPFKQRWALGLEVDPVRKRLPGTTPVFEPHTGTVSAFASLYYQSTDGRSVGAVHVGRYLGGDAGSTFELERRFDNGLRLSGWLTGTTGTERLGVAVAQQRDHFDGGLRLSLSLGALPLFTPESRVEVEMLPLARDSGQRAEVPFRLEPLTRAASTGAVSGGWDRLLD